ncbi:hypothetical protein ACFXAS_31590 [Streptomyces sp. NPDC059459]|uniref:hypothetical protein n=1 Tax=Streptomyces sp. NPDC059459 TaxID=3346839 RepID=UPI00368DB08A
MSTAYDKAVTDHLADLPVASSGQQGALGAADLEGVAPLQPFRLPPRHSMR